MATPTATNKNPRPWKRVKYDFGDTVNVLVGKFEKLFVCYVDVLTDSSPFFKAACSGEWREAKERTIRLPEQDATAFSIYLHWLYMGTANLWDGPEDKKTWVDGSGAAFQFAGNRWHNMIRSAALAEMLQAHAFGNALTDSYLDLVLKTNTAPSAHIVNTAFALLPKTSKIRQLLVRQLAYNTDTAYVKGSADAYDHEACKEIVVLSVEERLLPWKDKIPTAKGKCFFHVHPEGESEVHLKDDLVHETISKEIADGIEGIGACTTRLRGTRVMRRFSKEKVPY